MVPSLKAPKRTSSVEGRDLPPLVWGEGEKQRALSPSEGKALSKGKKTAGKGVVEF